MKICYIDIRLVFKMCTVNEEYDGALEFIPEEKRQTLDEVLCQKCNVEKADILLRGKDVYCNTCFLAHATHKFRATLGKSKIVRPMDKILVAHSGRAGSMALLHLIKAGMHESVHKRLVFETKVLYIDDEAVENRSTEERTRIIEEVGEQISSLGFQSFALSLSQSLENENPRVYTLDTLSNSLADFASSDEKLRSALVDLEDDTSRSELVKKLRQRLLFAAARNLGCNKIFVGDHSTSLAIEILSNVSLGRGAQLSLDVGFIDNRFSDVMLVRPMRDFSRHELTNYAKIHKLRTIDGEKNSTAARTIQEITEKFINDLDSQYSGTVSTVFRTGEKVCAVSNKEQRNDDTCALCHAPLDTVSSDNVISAIQATAFSRLVSTRGQNGYLDTKAGEIENSSSKVDKVTNGCGKCTDRCTKDKQQNVSAKNLNKFLCYGCRLIFRNSKVETIPSCILNEIQQRISFENMREEITDFLL